MRHVRKLFAFALTLVMAFAMCATAIADSTPTGNVTSDATISVTGLEQGDSVTFYQVLKYDSEAADTHGWSNGDGFNLTEDQIQKILGTDAYMVGSGVQGKDGKGGIDEDLAATIADMTKNSSATYVKYTATAGTDKKASYDKPDAGLYVAIVSPANAGTMYNPVFVAADYKSDNSSNTQAATTDLSYSPESMAKRADTTLDKTAVDATSIDTNKSETVGVGDVVTFTVTTTIPEFAGNYTAAAFTVTDTMSDGLQLQNAANSGAASEQDNSIAVKVNNQNVAPSNYDLTASATGYTVDFKTEYLLGLEAASDLVITYNAKVTTDAPTSLNKEENTVVVSFSNNPNDTTSKTKLVDRTNHYTFDIDANLLGDTTDSWQTTEVVKVGLDQNGNEITTTNTTLHQGQTSVGALQGAEFKLYTDEACTTAYTNNILTADNVIVSDANGRLTIRGESKPGIRGLDAGTYYLKETKAPDGYIKHQDAIKIEIIPSWDNQYVEEIDSEGTTIEVTTKVLTSYVVKINNVQTASYTIMNAKEDVASESDQGDTVTGNNSAGYIQATGGNAAAGVGKITNTQGTELPSTGGIGTTIFYIVGGVLILLAGVYLVTKRRMSSND
jgi:fimbrial isopeptide formation D2 family protein/LPXTG-motif cell wall-anchored protein